MSIRLRRNSELDSRRRFSPVLWGASVGAVAVLALAVTGTLGQLTASIRNTQNFVETGGPESFGVSESLVTSEGPQTPCQTAFASQELDCAAINKLGQDGQLRPLVPGTQNVTTVQLQNVAPATGCATPAVNSPTCIFGDLYLVAPICQNVPQPGVTPAPTGDLCALTTLTVDCNANATPVYTGTLAGFTGVHLAATGVAPQAVVNCQFTTTLPSTLTPAQAASVLGLQAQQQPLDWIFQQTGFPAPTP